MDKKYLKEQGLLEAQRHFQRLYEYTFIGANDLTNEAENDEEMEVLEMPADDMNAPAEGGNEMSGDEMSAMGNNSPVGDNNDMMMNPEGEETPESGVKGLNPQPEMEGEGGLDDVETEQEGDEVIDVDDLTNAQEEIDGKVSELDDKFSKLMAAVEQFDNLINSNNAKIDDLKAELEKRNPTPVEKLNLRAKEAYPFNVAPDDFWKEKGETSNYEIGDDMEDNEEEYIITQGDIDDATDWKNISDSLKNGMNPSLTDILKY